MGSAPLNPPALGEASPHAPLMDPTPGLRHFWIESPSPLVSVSESGSQKILSFRNLQ